MSSIYTRPDGTRGAIKKRKEPPQPWDPPLNQIPVKKPGSVKLAQPAHSAQVAKPTKPVEPNNKLLAGYLAHEFLTNGTLLGKRFEQGKMDVDPAHAGPSNAGPSKPGNLYKEVSYLLKADGVHLAGIVNPTQLGSWLQK